MIAEIPRTDFIPNIISPDLLIKQPSIDSVKPKTGMVDRLINVPTNASINEDKSPPISLDELSYILDSLKDLENGDYYSSTPDQTFEEFMAELRK